MLLAVALLAIAPHPADNFGMYLPLLIKFDQGEALVRPLVRGPTTEAIARAQSARIGAGRRQTEAWN